MSSPLNIEKSGAGDPLVLIHGMGSASNAFKPIRSTLDKDFLVVTLDLPGHGKSPYQKGELMDPHSLALKVLEQLSDISIDKFHLAGNSLGGWIAMEMAAIAPARVRSLVGIAPAGLWLNPYNARYPGTALARFLARYTVKLAPTALHFELARGWVFLMLALAGKSSLMNYVLMPQWPWLAQKVITRLGMACC